MKYKFTIHYNLTVCTSGATALSSVGTMEPSRLIENYNPLEIRNDVGPLWENFCIIERKKRNEIRKIFVNLYFWRAYSQKEIDLIEEREGRLFGYEIKWKKDNKRPPKEWLSKYNEAEFFVINRDNYLDFIL